MKLNGDEERIQRLFREIRSGDQLRAPSFDGVVAAAYSRESRSRRPTATVKLALVVSTLIVVAIAAAAIIRGRMAPASEQQTVAVPLEEEFGPVRASIAPAGTVRRALVRRVRHVPRRRVARDPAIDVKALFAWQSPTASLLKSSRDLFVTVPRVGESLQTIRGFSPDLWN